MNVPGVVVWALVLALVVFLLLAVGLIASVVWVSGGEAEQERRRWEGGG